MIIYYYIGNKSSQFMIFGARKFPQNLDYVHKLQVWVSQLLIRQYVQQTFQKVHELKIFKK